MNNKPWDFSEAEATRIFDISDDVINVLKRSSKIFFAKGRRQSWAELVYQLRLPDWLQNQLSPTTEILYIDALEKWVVTTTCPEDMELLTNETLLTLACGQ